MTSNTTAIQEAAHDDGVDDLLHPFGPDIRLVQHFNAAKQADRRQAQSAVISVVGVITPNLPESVSQMSKASNNAKMPDGANCTKSVSCTKSTSRIPDS